MPGRRGRDALRVGGKFSAALQCYKEHNSLAQGLALQDAENTKWQYHLSLSCYRLSLVYEKLKDMPRAVEYAKEAIKIDESLVAREPSNATWQEQLGNSRRRVKNAGAGMKEREE